MGSYDKLGINRVIPITPQINMSKSRGTTSLTVLGILMLILIVLLILQALMFGIISVMTNFPSSKAVNIPDRVLDYSKKIISDTAKAASHYIVDQSFISAELCTRESSLYGLNAQITTIDLIENIPLVIKADELSVSNTWQLCYAHHDHQHGFKLKTYPNPNAVGSSEQSQADCDLYLSATSTLPNSSNWDWKSTDNGYDSITIYQFASEFRRSKLKALFITINEKSGTNNVERSHIRNRCVLEIEVLTVRDEDLLHKMGSLRGGQIMLPRDLNKLRGI